MPNNRQKLTKEEVIDVFSSEYSALLGKFSIYKLPLDEVDKNKSIYHPGVYVFWKHEYGVIKVGRSLSNSKKRALQHLQDNTKAKDGTLEMRQLKNDPNTSLLLFNVILPKDYHWILGLEYFLEQNLSPLIKSLRNG